ncbi:MAG: hypothetical protein ABI675_27355 [Chitinophagaceae bacterium]
MRVIIPICIVLPILFCLQCKNRVNPVYPDGGYDYPAEKANIDTNNYAYPIRDLISSRDSLYYAYYERYWGLGFNEPNLSIRPETNTVFRLTYRTAFGDGTIIKLTEDKIVIKQLIEGNPFPEYDSTNLTKLENRLYWVLRSNFPIQDQIANEFRTQSLERLTKTYPQLLDPMYYINLLNKSMVPSQHPVVYTTKEKQISKRFFLKLVTQINSSGYWKMPYEPQPDPNISSMDGYSFI